MRQEAAGVSPGLPPPSPIALQLGEGGQTLRPRPMTNPTGRGAPRLSK